MLSQIGVDCAEPCASDGQVESVGRSRNLASYHVVFYSSDGRPKQAIELRARDDAAVVDQVCRLHYANAVEVYRDSHLLKQVDGALIRSDRSDGA